LERAARQRYLDWPAAQENSLLRLARRRLLGGQGAVRFKSAASRQGLLQIIHDFRAHSNALCAHCPFPDLNSHYGRPNQETVLETLVSDGHSAIS
jgi:hypothetical protein